VAHELARRGASVRIVEERAPGMGATHAAAGIPRAAYRSELAPHSRSGRPSLNPSTTHLMRRPIAGARFSTVVPARFRLRSAKTAWEPKTPLRGSKPKGSPLHPGWAGGGAEEPQLSHDVAGGLVIPSWIRRRRRATARPRRSKDTVRKDEGQPSDRIVATAGDVTVETIADHSQDRRSSCGRELVRTHRDRRIASASPGASDSRPAPSIIVEGLTLRRVVWSDRCISSRG
jgi:hypothetical protein